MQKKHTIYERELTASLLKLVSLFEAWTSCEIKDDKASLEMYIAAAQEHAKLVKEFHKQQYVLSE